MRGPPQLDSGFYSSFADFGQSSPTQLAISTDPSLDDWLPDATFAKCQLCNTSFSAIKRRHHCRFCGLIYCASCTENRAALVGENARVCPSCAVVLLSDTTSTHFNSLRAWSSSDTRQLCFDGSPKAAGMRFFCEILVTTPCVAAHKNAVHTLLRFFPGITPALMDSGGIRFLLEHSFDCKCEVAPLTIALAATVIAQNPVKCSASLVQMLPRHDLLPLFDNTNMDFIRGLCRLVYVLSLNKLVEVPDVAKFALQFASDPWAVAYLLATDSLAFPIPHLDKISDDRKIDGLEISPEFVKFLIVQFEKGTTASRYFGSIILERIAHCETGIDLILKEDLFHVGQYISQNRPKDAKDARPAAMSALLAAVVLLKAWRRAVEVKHAGHRALFSATINPLAPVLALETAEGEQCFGRVAQAIFLEMLAMIATFDDLLLAVHNEDMMSTVVGLAVAQDAVGDGARKALFTMSRVDVPKE
jgi:hypothetical protein